MSLMQKLKEKQVRGNEESQLLLTGKAGLAKLFWRYWFLLIVFVNIVYSIVEKQKYLIMCGVFSVYAGFTAAKGVVNIIKEGNNKWAVVALMVIIINLLVDLSALFMDVSTLLQR